MEKASHIEIKDIDTGSTEFQNALKLIQYTSQSVFLTGKAGTGKSTFLQYLRATTKKKHVVLAPTGIAAVNAGGSTLHSFFKLPFKPMLPTDPELLEPRRLKSRFKYTKEFVKMLRAIDLFIIDEVSMVRADTIDLIDRLLRVYCGNDRQPFGGKQLLLVGDVFQLEPVITADTRDVLAYFYRQGAFFFNARAFRDLSIVPIELTKVYRQKDADFISLLDRIRVGAPTMHDIDRLNIKVIPENTLDLDQDFVMTIATRREIVDRINETRLGQLKTPERTFMGVIKGDFPENSLPTDLKLVIKEGAQVVFVKNDMEHRWVNGTLGRICEICEDTIRIELEDGTRHVVEPDVWGNVKYDYDEEKKEVIEKEIGSFTQFPIKLAWALTIHKSQGLTFDKVTIDIGPGAFSGGQTYVALSRCRSLDGIRMRSTINARDIFVNPKVVNFSRDFNNEMLIDLALENARADDCYHRAAKAFDNGDIAGATRLFAEAVTACNHLDKENVVRLLGMKLSALTTLRHQVETLQRQVEDDRHRFLKLATEYVEMGEECRAEGWDINAAIANYDKALTLAPDYAAAWLGKGLCIAQTGDLDAAMEAITHASRLDPQDYRAPYEAGRLLLGQRDLTGAMDFLLQAVDRNDRIAGIHLALAEIYDAVGDTKKAASHRKTAQKLTKKNQKK